MNHKDQQNRAEFFQLLSDLDGRQAPAHPMHGFYTGLYENRTEIIKAALANHAQLLRESHAQLLRELADCAERLCARLQVERNLGVAREVAAVATRARAAADEIDGRACFGGGEVSNG